MTLRIPLRNSLRNPLRNRVPLLRCVLHPFNSFYSVKEEGKGSLLQAAIILVVYFFSSVMYRQNTGFAFNYNDLSDLNIWLIGAKTIGLFGLWTAANWAVATWMEGEGKAAQIMMVSAYALVPYIASLLLTTMLSNVLLVEEGAFLHYLTVIGMLWSGLLMVIGLQTIHDYEFGRNLRSLVLTLAGIGIIVFLGVLFYTLFQQACAFIYTIYNELLFRY